jgi:branched-chain amino acid aminotransferase
MSSPMTGPVTTPKVGSMQFDIQVSSGTVDAEARARHLADPGFGRVFTDHMVSVRWTRADGWHDAGVVPYAPLVLEPASSVLHYSQSVIEGLKAYRQLDGRIALFRPDRNGERLAASCRRLALPELPVADFVTACELLVRADSEWVPAGDGTSLYLRPLMIADEVGLMVRPSESVHFLLIASPAARYFSGPLRAISLWLTTEYVRAAPGGTGAAKCGGNYAASLVAQQEAMDHGCDQVVFVDAIEHRWVDELAGSNIFFVLDDGTLVTPELSGAILDGVTRDCVITLARQAGRRVEERRVAADEWCAGARSGRIAEVFACGTAAVITPIGTLKWRGGEVTAGDGTPGSTTLALRRELTDLQYGRTSDPYGWLRPVT